MRYKIIWGKDDKRDKWGHFIASYPQHVEWASDNIEAECRALELSKSHKKYEIIIYDTEGPEFEGGTTWFYAAYKGGKRIDSNPSYSSALLQKQLYNTVTF